MNYDFDKLTDRRGSGCVKWDLFPGTLPMWVADMDFEVAPEIRTALQRRLDHGVFGYELVGDDYFAAIDNWFTRRHGWSGISRGNIVPTTGVIAAYAAAIKALTIPGDNVLVQTPCYNAFFPAITANGCKTLENPLRYSEGKFSIDWEDFEQKVLQAKVFLLCNPHNPVGRVWTREELLRIAEICYRNHVPVIADEIHCEFVYPGHVYTPWATLPEQYVRASVSCISPTKAFNIAGIQIANLFASDSEMFRKMHTALHQNQCGDVNCFGVAALKAAYNEAGCWLDQLIDYLHHNTRTVACFLKDELPGITAPPLEGTYLMWLDCRAAMRDGEPLEGFSERFASHLRERHGLVLSTGTIYGAVAEGFERLNIACPRTRLLEGLSRLRDGFESYRP